MHLQVLAVGTRMPAWVDEGCRQYATRMPRHCTLTIRAVAASPRRRGDDLARCRRDEGARLLKRLPAGAHVIALERSGRTMSTPQVAAQLEQWLAEGRDCAFLIGGPEGLDHACLDRADDTWSLSALTLAHPLARLVLAEQLYRAWSVVAGLPYHRGDDG